MQGRLWILGLALIATPGLALAHASGDHAHGFLQGVIHPATGLDHLLAMVAVGLIAMSRDRRVDWTIPISFLGFMLAGAILGRAGLSVPFVEQGILASILVLGLLITIAGMLPRLPCAAIIGGFAVFHGMAHGAEMPQTVRAVSFLAGLMLSTGVLHGLGMLAGRALVDTKAMRHAGFAISLGGLVLAAYA
jgi:urease accessory protein